MTSYVVQYKEAEDAWRNTNFKKIIAGEKTDAFIDSLKPATNYHFRVYAENHLGTSAASDILNVIFAPTVIRFPCRTTTDCCLPFQVQTDSKIPSAPPQQVTVEPLGRQQLIVTWRPPDHVTWNGELLGYTIGLKRVGSLDSSTNYTRVGIPGGEIVNDFRLTDLEKYTQYSITVAAFNVKGDGPSSDPVVARTIEDGK